MSSRDWVGISVVWLVAWLVDKPLPTVFEWRFLHSNGQDKLVKGRVVYRRLELIGTERK